VQAVSIPKTLGAKMKGEPKTVDTGDLMNLFNYAAKSTPI